MFIVCFISQWIKRSKHELFVFTSKKTLIWRRHCSIGQSCWSVTSKRSIGWFLESPRAWSFLPERSLNQLKATRVCIRSINRSNRSLSVRLLYLFCSGVFIARSYENRSMYSIATGYKTNTLFLCVFYSRKSQERRQYITSLWIYNLNNSSLTVSLQELL